jgi:CheY-like chemotaxis protein
MNVPRRLMVAEDDQDDQELMKFFLSDRSDIQLMNFAKDGVQLWETLELIPEEKQLPDLIILDQNMPRQNGIQTLKALKSSKRYNNIPVVIYSTYADDLLIHRAVESGATLILSKPLNRPGYHEMIDTIFQAIKE